PWIPGFSAFRAGPGLADRGPGLAHRGGGAAAVLGAWAARRAAHRAALADDRLARYLRRGHVLHHIGLRDAVERELGRLPAALGVHDDDLPRPELAEQDLLGQAVLDLPLDGATQRPGPENRVVAARGQQVLGRRAELDGHVAVLQPVVHLGDHQ